MSVYYKGCKIVKKGEFYKTSSFGGWKSCFYESVKLFIKCGVLKKRIWKWKSKI